MAAVASPLRLTMAVALVVILSPFLAPAPPLGEAAGASSRRVSVRPTVGSVAWGTAPILWFGQATESNNYVDVRVAYDNQSLYISATIVDYYLWFDPTGAADPRQHDALAIFLDTNRDRAASPQADDYLLVSGFRSWPPGNDVRWHRQARGASGAWNESWAPTTAWTDSVGGRWYNSGPNGNSDRDAGWATTITIPWAALGLSGAPAAGTNWGMGVAIYDRDAEPPAVGVTPEVWPETLSATSPSTWASLAFDPSPYQPPPATVTGTISIRRGLNGTVDDAYVGGGGDCGGGIFGGGDVPHPTNDLFVQNEADVSDFPCYSKSYLRFDLSAIPPGEVIISATLRIYQFGGSAPSQARPSLVQLLSVPDSWSESTLTWNNAPLAGENLSSTWVNPILSFPGWPGVASTWDATELVADAYASGRSASLVLYSADTDYHSGKYFTSSETGDWNAGGRPTLTVVWGSSAGFRVVLPVIK